ncbi:magnesium-translocating P-type ATPase [Aerococcus sp. HMSC10H05]|uniref:magnesium-translocating P-type ATPase n=1 Tax=Aerococcus sp. HMSC10H05 TaxID=1581084 RepID=UPI000AFC35DE|nr:magnesium-translocating P-type ATPase [Aerococcus sp. HMSC10H05]
MMNNRDQLGYFELASKPILEIKEIFKAKADGFKENEADQIRSEYGDNEINYGNEKSLWRYIFEAYFTPFTLVLLGLALISFLTDYVFVDPAEQEILGPIIIVVLIILSGTMSLIQTIRSNQSVEALESMVEVTSAVKREGQYQEIRTEDIVIGDLVRLKAGDMIPADIRLLNSKDLFVSQTSLTGESHPVEKRAKDEVEAPTSETDYTTLVFTGSEVVSGVGEGVVVRTGNNTLFGGIADAFSNEPIKTSFDVGIEKTSLLLIRFMGLMAVIVILINGLTKGDWLQALLFGISIAVGLTPEMLPMIVTTNLVKGAKDMKEEGTIVRNLQGIQNFGAIDVLVTDKTGTLTQDNIVLQHHLNIDGEESNRVLRHAYLNSYYQTGLGNLMDKAIIRAGEEELAYEKLAYTKVDEIPFDFERRRLSVVVEDQTGKTQMITKGAIEEMLAVSSYVDYAGEILELTDQAREKVLAQVAKLNSQGLRVLGVAQKTNPSPVDAFSVKDESEMVLIGYLAFLDPPKPSTKAAIKALNDHAVNVKIMTGDNELVTVSVAEQVGIPTDHIISGDQLVGKSDEELREIAEKHSLFVKLNPTQKSTLVTILRENGHVVGFLGDGINDSPALRAADVGISVDNAVDIAKESADIILLEKDLMILEKGILAGRKVFGNTMKYIKATTSSNFGNVFSVLIASIFLPFLPMLPIQLLFLGLIYEIASMSLPWDDMDKEYLYLPKKWEASSIQKFMVWFGPTSSIFDVTTFIITFFLIAPSIAGGQFVNLNEGQQALFIAIFQSSWFIVSLWTQTLVLYTLRTPKIPFIQSRPSNMVLAITGIGILIGTFAPYTGLGRALGLAALPIQFWGLLAATVVLYLILVQIVKHIYVKRHGELL